MRLLPYIVNATVKLSHRLKKENKIILSVTLFTQSKNQIGLLAILMVENL